MSSCINHKHWNYVFTRLNGRVINHQMILSLFVCLCFLQFMTVSIVIKLTCIFSWIKICLTYSLNMCTVRLSIIPLVSQCNIGMMEDNWELANSWSRMGYLKSLFLGSLISFRNGSVLITNILILIFKWIRNKNSKLIIN